MFIYMTTNLINEKIYIGKYCGRDKSYLGSGLAFNRAVKKYGKENFSRETLEDGIEDHNYLCEREIYWIAFYDSTNPKIGYNIAKGGKGNFGVIPSDETRKRLSLANKGRIVSEETKRKQSENHADFSGENSPNFGKRGKETSMFGRCHTKETKRKQSEAQMGEKNHSFGKIRTNESRKKQSESWTDEKRKRQSEKISGKNNPNFGKTGKDTSQFGKHHTKETRQKQSDAMKLYWKNKKAQDKKQDS